MNRSHDPQKQMAGYFPLTPGCFIGILIILAYDHPWITGQFVISYMIILNGSHIPYIPYTILILYIYI